MTTRRFNAVRTLCQWLFAIAIIGTVWGVAHHHGRLSGEQGVGYWQGWQDAMIQTDYGRKPYDSNEPPLK